MPTEVEQVLLYDANLKACVGYFQILKRKSIGQCVFNATCKSMLFSVFLRNL